MMEVALKGRVLELLGELQTISDRIDTMELMRKEVKAASDTIEERLSKAQSELEQQQAQKHVLDMERRKKEVQLKAEKERHQRIKGRVGEVKTSREYQAVVSETNSAKQGRRRKDVRGGEDLM